MRFSSDTMKNLREFQNAREKIVEENLNLLIKFLSLEEKPTLLYIQASN